MGSNARLGLDLGLGLGLGLGGGRSRIRICYLTSLPAVRDQTVSLPVPPGAEGGYAEMPLAPGSV
jgi:hypothetical protein